MKRLKKPLVVISIGHLAISCCCAASGSAITPASFGVSQRDLQRSTIMETRFSGSSLPSGWVASSGWEVNNGLSTPGSGGWTVAAYWSKRCKLDQTDWSAKIVLNDASSRFALIRKDIYYNSVGSVALFDAANGRAVLFGAWDGSTATDSYRSNNLAAAVVTGREYLLSLRMNSIGRQSFTVTDLTTGTKTTVTADDGGGLQYDAPGFLFLQGDVTVTWCAFSTPFPRMPQVAILGDSFIEGYSLRPNYSDRYALRLYEELAGSCVVAGMGGESASSITNRFEVDLMSFRPRYTFVPIGLNDTDFATWLGAAQTISNRVASIGSELILATLPPRADRQSFINQVNNWIRITNQWHRYTDLARAVTTDHDGLTQDASLYLGDAIHPNSAGHAAMAARAKADLPEIFNPPSDRPPFYASLDPDTPKVTTRFPLEVRTTNSSGFSAYREHASFTNGLSLSADSSGGSIQSLGAGNISFYDHNTTKLLDVYSGAVLLPGQLRTGSSQVTNTLTASNLVVTSSSADVAQFVRHHTTFDNGISLSAETSGGSIQSIGAGYLNFYDHNSTKLLVLYSGAANLPGQLRSESAVVTNVLTSSNLVSRSASDTSLQALRTISSTDYGVALSGETGGGVISSVGGTTIMLYDNAANKLATFQWGSMLLPGEIRTSSLMVTNGMYLYDGSVFRQVSIGANDSAGTGYRLLRIPNSP